LGDYGLRQGQAEVDNNGTAKRYKRLFSFEALRFKYSSKLLDSV
jgi:hypothetical protein